MDATRLPLADLVYTEALCLDQQRWQDWLDLYLPDATFRVPSWKDEHTPTNDPASEISLIYAANRARLEERVRRAIGGKSMASQPLPRTLHCISNILPTAGGKPDAWLVRSNCVTHLYDLRTETLRLMACRYEHVIEARADGLRIAGKTACLINDKVPTVLDFYSV